MELTHIGLFSGIGGDALAAQWAGFKTLALCELDEYCRLILRRNWPDEIIWEDIENVREREFEAIRRATGGRPVTLISGGYPCQGESLAGKRGGEGDDRWLWPEMLRIIRALRPAWVVGENVTGHVTMGFPRVLADLEGEGYQTRAFLIPACAVGALHKRERVFIVANTSRQHVEEPLDTGGEAGRRPYGQPAGSGEVVAHADHRELLCPPDPVCSGGISPQHGRPVADPNVYREKREQPGHRTGGGSEQGSEIMADSYSTRKQELPGGIKEGGHGAGDRSKAMADSEVIGVEGVRAEGEQESEVSIGEALSRWDGAGGRAGTQQWEVEPDLGRVVDGLPSRVDKYIHRRRLEALGNAIVPQQIYPIFRAIALIEGGFYE